MIWKQGAGAWRLCRAAALVGIVASLGGCSSVPDAVNPVSWYHGVVGSDDEKPAAKPNALSGDKSVPNADKPYPSIGTVPDKPPPPSTEAERAAAAKSLVADNADAHYADMEIRRQIDESGTPPPPSAALAPAPSAGPERSAAATTGTSSPSTPHAPSAPAAPTKDMAPTPVVPPAPPRAATPPSRQVLAPAPGNSPARRNFAAGPVPQVPAAPPPAPRIPTAPPDSASAAPRSNAAAPSAGSAVPEQRVAQRRAATPEAPLVFGPPPPDIAIAEQMPKPQSRSPTARSTRRPARVPQQQRMTQNADGDPASVPASTYGPYFPSGVPFVRRPVQGAALPGYRGERLASIYFRSGSARLGSRDVAAIREAVRTWRARGGIMVIIGHASPDSRGGNSVRHEMSNFSISLDRANAVAREIMRLGVDPSAVRVKAVSDAQPAYYPSGAASGAESRRADILIEQ
jgi:outer membrane protein OmpA-like peptidoglycan-associated protein